MLLRLPAYGPASAHALKTLPTCTSLQVEFKLLGFIPGSVGLRGKFVSIPEREGGENRKDTVKVRCGFGGGGWGESGW